MENPGEPGRVDQPLEILLVEDSQADAELLARHLEDFGLRVSFLRVDSAKAMGQALAERTWDLVLADYAMPGFGGLEALALLKESGQDIPFLLVSGVISDETMLQALKAGAHDVLAKARLGRLGPAIERELREAAQRRRRREAEEELRDTQEQIAAIGQAAGEAIVMTDAHFRITYWNPMAEVMFGYPKPYATGRDLPELLLVPGSREIYRNLFRRALRLGGGAPEHHTAELVARSKIGSEIYLEASLSTAMLRGRWHAVGILRDITQRKAMEQDWHEQLQFFRTVIESIPNPVYYKDADGRFLGCNRACQEMVGMAEEEIQGKTVWDLLPEPLAAEHAAVDQEVVDTAQTRTYESQALAAGGARLYVIESKAPFFDLERRVVGIVGTLLDITDRKNGELEKARLEIQLRQAQKLEAIGQLAAGIAHEINTPIQFIGDNTVFVKDTFRGLLAFLKAAEGLFTGDGPPSPGLLEDLRRQYRELDADYLLKEIPQAVEQTQDGVARVARIVGAMKDFSHPGQESKSGVDLNHAIESTLIISRNAWKYVAELETSYDPGLPSVPCFPSEFNQVVLNLVINAAHAIQEAQASRGPGYRGLIRVSTRREGCEVLVRVEDNGTGIPAAIREKIYDPFFTTKPIGKGTGQGLSIAHSVIVDKHQGRLTLETEVGKGTVFTIALPLGLPSD